MPELAKPLASPGTSLKEQRSSKSPTVPLVQIRNVFPLAGFSAVVWPVMAPSLTDQSFGIALPAGQVFAVEDSDEAPLCGAVIEQGQLAAQRGLGQFGLRRAGDQRRLGR